MADFKKAKKAFEKLKIDPSSAAFAEEILDKKLLVKLKKSKYAADRNFFNIVNNSVIFDSDNVNRTDYVEKREIDHSTLHSFSSPHELFHAAVGNPRIPWKEYYVSRIRGSSCRLIFIKSLHLPHEI